MKLAFITLTNNGYKEMTKNCLISLKKLGISYLKVYCIDQESYDYLSKDFENIFKMDIGDEEVEKDLINFRYKKWSKIVFKKFNIIYKELQENDYVLFTDGDIVYKKKGFVEYCLDQIGNNELIIQDDRFLTEPIDSSGYYSSEVLCTGFMMIKKNDNMLKIFNPENIPELDIDCDQYYINKTKENIKFKKLPCDLFPNGSYFRLKNPVNNFLIHFNYILGTRKKEKMIKYGYWYL